jgi:hypothetical protein
MIAVTTLCTQTLRSAEARVDDAHHVVDRDEGRHGFDTVHAEQRNGLREAGDSAPGAE